MHVICRAGVCLLLTFSTIGVIDAQTPAAGTASWPGYRGEYRDGVYREPIRLVWEGLTPMWKKPIGGGRASFAVAGGRAFTIEQRKRRRSRRRLRRDDGPRALDQRVARAIQFDADGIMGGGEGPRATPTLADGLVYALGGRGEFRCLDAATGKLVWRTNILRTPAPATCTWGMAASPLVAGDAVIVLPGGPKGRSVAAYDRRTGKKLWTALDDKAAYASPMLVTIGGVPQFLAIVGSTAGRAESRRRDVLWEFPWKHRARRECDPTHRDWRQPDLLLVRLRHWCGRARADEDRRRFSVREVWRNIRMKNRQSTSVLHDGFIYGLDEGILACIDVATGELKWKGGRYGHGQLLLAGDHLVVITEEGDLVLVAASPERLREVARVPAIDGETWNVPAIRRRHPARPQHEGDGGVRPAARREVVRLRSRAIRANVSPDSRTRRGCSGSSRSRASSDVPTPLDELTCPSSPRSGDRAAQPPRRPEPPAASIFFSWGYNGDNYANSDIHFSQPSLGNDFTIVDVQARDSKTWTDSLFAHGLFVPQYNIRIGIFFNEKWGVELALDHVKWIVKDDQAVRMTGTLNGAPVDTDVTLTADVLRYQLNNGANPHLLQPDQALAARGRARTHGPSHRPRQGGRRVREPAHGEHGYSACRTTRAFSSSRPGTSTRPPPSALHL